MSIRPDHHGRLGVAALAVLLALAITLVSGSQKTRPVQAGFEGYWLGTLSARARELRLLIHVTTGDRPSATLTSIDQSNEPQRLDRVVVDDRSIVLEGTSPVIRVSGTLRADRSAFDAVFEQGGATFQLVFTRVDGPPRLHRPQHPVPPFPYIVEEVLVQGPVTLAGTVTRPFGAGPFPAVLLISGSGPQDRDQTIFGHKTFLVIADHLTRNGLAVLRLDDRGAGASAGSRAAATMMDYAMDAQAAIGFLEKRRDIDRKRIGLIGHSEGGVVAPLVAKDTPAVSFMVLIAAPAMTGASIAMLQGERIARAAGATREQIELQQTLNRRIFDVIASEADETRARAAIRAVLTDELRRAGIDSEAAVLVAEKQMEPQIRRGLSPWFRHFLTYDPLPTLMATRVPTLGLYGGLDVQVPAFENAGLMAKALASGPSGSEVRTIPELNHLFQTARTGAMDEYGRLDETFAPAALTVITNWIQAVIRRLAGSTGP